MTEDAKHVGIKPKTLRAIRRCIEYEQGAVAFWQELRRAVEAGDGSAIAILNDRLARAEHRRDRLLAAVEANEEVGVRELYRRIMHTTNGQAGQASKGVG